MPAHPSLLAHWAESERRLRAVLAALTPSWPANDLADARHFVDHNEHGCAVDLMEAVGERHGWGDQREAFLAACRHMRSYVPPAAETA